MQPFGRRQDGVQANVSDSFRNRVAVCFSVAECGVIA
jgi:hypothetical protein